MRVCVYFFPSLHGVSTVPSSSLLSPPPPSSNGSKHMGHSSSLCAALKRFKAASFSKRIASSSPSSCVDTDESKCVLPRSLLPSVTTRLLSLSLSRSTWIARAPSDVISCWWFWWWCPCPGLVLPLPLPLLDPSATKGSWIRSVLWSLSCCGWRRKPLKQQPITPQPLRRTN